VCACHLDEEVEELRTFFYGSVQVCLKGGILHRGLNIMVFGGVCFILLPLVLLPQTKIILGNLIKFDKENNFLE
jgi:hypothetical protein